MGEFGPAGRRLGTSSGNVCANAREREPAFVPYVGKVDVIASRQLPVSSLGSMWITSSSLGHARFRWQDSRVESVVEREPRKESTSHETRVTRHEVTRHESRDTSHESRSQPPQDLFIACTPHLCALHRARPFKIVWTLIRIFSGLLSCTASPPKQLIFKFLIYFRLAF